MALKAHWVPDTNNWGDAFTPFLFDMLAFKAEWTEPEMAEVFCCGSLLERVPRDFSGWIMGSGAGYSSTCCDMQKIRWPLLLRGLLAANNCVFGEVKPRYGDPGLLARNLRDTSNTKAYALGIVPHVVDKDLDEVRRWKERAVVIDVSSGIRQVVNAIDSCEKIVSSSLHGLVIANSLGVPCHWVKLSDGVMSEFKFHDYYSAYGVETAPASTIEEASKKCFTVDISAVFDTVSQTFMEFADEASAYLRRRPEPSGDGPVA